MKKRKAVEESLRQLSDLLGRPVSKQELTSKLSYFQSLYPELSGFYFPKESK